MQLDCSQHQLRLSEYVLSRYVSVEVFIIHNLNFNLFILNLYISETKK